MGAGALEEAVLDEAFEMLCEQMQSVGTQTSRRNRIQWSSPIRSQDNRPKESHPIGSQDRTEGL